MSGPAARMGAVLATAGLTCALLLGAATSGRAERDRPPPGYTGGFSEPACQECHMTAPVNTGGGTLSVEGLPAEFEPGSTYDLTITLTQEGLGAGGFQLSARFEDGTQAGTLAPAQSDTGRIDVSVSGAVEYIHHMYAGTMSVAPDTARWRIRWTAPAAIAGAGTAVILHVAANAADDDESPMGDLIYTTSVRTAAGK